MTIKQCPFCGIKICQDKGRGLDGLYASCAYEQDHGGVHSYLDPKYVEYYETL